MKKFFIIIICLILTELTFAQNRLTGTIYNKDTKKPIASAMVTAGTVSVVSDANGRYELKNFPQGKLTITITALGFASKTITVSGKGNTQGEDIYISESSAVPMADISASELDADESTGYGGQAVSSLLTSSQDVFDRNVGYALSFAYFRPRGYDNEYNSIFINGALMNDAENGRASYSEWGGLNDATRNKEIVSGLLPNDFSFGNLGGEQNINMRASAIPKQHKVGYSLSNRTYWHRLMYTFGSGLTRKGWAFSASISRRWGNGGYVPGTVYDGWGYYAAVEKRFGTTHSLNLTAFGSPTKRGQQGGSYQEVYDLMGSNYYNPNWGYQDGKVRNARIRQTFTPTFLLTWDFTPDTKTKLTTTASYQFGRYGTTALNWYDAPDPRPDYYRYLPSYQTDPVIADLVADLWKNSTNKSQIDWNALYQVNYTQNEQGKQAKYIVEDRRNDVNDFTFNSVLNRELTEHIQLNAGLRIRNSISHNFKTISDLLGGTYWRDIDQFAERDFSSNAIEIQNDINNPNRKVKEGDIFGYDYNIQVETNKLYALVKLDYAHWDFYGGAEISSTHFWRTGRMKNGR
ncbi:MAG: carboxypeptidase-like regulatory domain-containing protein, partial [Bacteroidales bacterium]